MSTQPTPSSQQSSAHTFTKPTPPINVLIVEDEALLAMDIEMMVQDSGHRVVGDVSCLREVTALPNSARPDLAFVDVQLAEGSSGLDVCTCIRDRWPDAVIVFVTANPRKVPADFAGGHGLISKPFSRNGLMTAIEYIAEGVIDPPPVSPCPASFEASPSFRSSWAGR